MINEGIHERLKEIYDEFDRHCRVNNIDYSIDADYRDAQGYRLLGSNDVSGVIRHISNYVKDMPVNFEYDGFPVDYNDLKAKNFNVPTYNPFFMFTLKPLQEERMQLDERQRHFPHRRHTDRQAQFRASMRPNEPGFQYEGGKGGKKKKKKKKGKTESESLSREGSFEDRLLSAINEQIVSTVDPDILFTKNTAPTETDVDQTLEDAKEIEEGVLKKYLNILENTENEEHALILENLIEKCTDNINQLNLLLNLRLEDINGTSRT